MSIDITVMVPIIVALGQAAKNFIPNKFMPIFSIVIGLVAGILVLPYETIQEGLMNGIVLGLSSMGLFDISKVVKKKNNA